MCVVLCNLILTMQREQWYHLLMRMILQMQITAPPFEQQNITVISLQNVYVAHLQSDVARLNLLYRSSKNFLN